MNTVPTDTGRNYDRCQQERTLCQQVIRSFRNKGTIFRFIWFLAVFQTSYVAITVFNALEGKRQIKVNQLIAPVENRSSLHIIFSTGGPSTCGRMSADDELLDRAICRKLLHTKNSTLLQNLIKGPLPEQIRWSPDAQVEDHYTSCAADCSRFRSEFGYFIYTDHVTEEELEFPLAFSILAYEQWEQTERLLRLIYRPHNFYCLHIDAKSPRKMHRAAAAVARCLQPNVFVLQPAINVKYGRISVVLAELACIRKLLKLSPKWKYFINLVGRDVPLRTNKELVQILRAYNGSNDIAGITEKRARANWFKYRWVNGHKTDVVKPKPPHGLKIRKGSAHIVARREFVQFALNDKRAIDFLTWCRDIFIPDEHFFNSLNHNPHLNIPGSYTGHARKSSLTRAKRWKTNHYEPGPQCAGRYIRSICSASVGDLPWISASPELFLNKIRQELDPAAFRCLELWYGDRVRQEVGVLRTKKFEVANGYGGSSSVLTDSSADQLNIQFYANQPWVKNHI